MANLYLFSYEFDFMERLAKEDYRSARKFNYTCRFIDDLETLNNDGKLSDLKEEIYPPELVCNKENEGNKKATFLDMETSVIGKRFISKTYDKRESYNFEIVNYPDLSGNIPRGSAYGVYTSQLIRYARVCSYKEDFINRAALLKEKLKENMTNLHLYQMILFQRRRSKSQFHLIVTAPVLISYPRHYLILVIIATSIHVYKFYIASY